MTHDGDEPVVPNEPQPIMQGRLDQPGQDILGDVLPVAPEGGKKRGLLIGVAAAATLAVAGAATAYALVLAPHGADPEEALPANTIGLLKIDLDPAADQKLAVSKIARKFPKSGVKGEKSVTDDLLSSVFNAADQGVSYSKDIKPWMGDRVGVASIPGKNGTTPNVAVAVQFTDKAKAEAGLKSLQKKLADKDADPLFFAFSDVKGYVLLSNDQHVVDAAAKTKKHLSDVDAFTSAVDALGGNQIVTGWMDVAGLFAALPKSQVKDNPLFAAGDLKPSGHYVVGLHAENNALELTGKTINVKSGVPALDSIAVGHAQGTNMVQSFPADVVGAVSIAGLGNALTKAFSNKDVTKALDTYGITEMADQAGFTLPEDINTLLGTDMAGYFTGTKDEPGGALRVKTKDAAHAKEIIRLAIKAANDDEDAAPITEAELDTYFATAEGGYVAGYPETALTAALNGKLGDDAGFKAAVPDADKASYLVYVNIDKVMANFDLEEAGKDALPLKAAGMTASQDGSTGTFKLRVTFN